MMIYDQIVIKGRILRVCYFVAESILMLTVNMMGLMLIWLAHGSPDVLVLMGAVEVFAFLGFIAVFGVASVCIETIPCWLKESTIDQAIHHSIWE